MKIHLGKTYTRPVDIVSPNNDMKGHLQQLLADFPMIDVKAMGFPTNWQDEPLWQG